MKKLTWKNLIIRKVLRLVAVFSLVVSTVTVSAALASTPGSSPSTEPADAHSDQHEGDDSQENELSVKQHRKGKIKREKDAEGTKAPNRFEGDINTKSQYHYRGQPLEVDTD